METVEKPTENTEETPITREEFRAQMQRLTSRAKAAGLKPIEEMAHSYARQGMTVLESLLQAFEEGSKAKKK